MNNSFLFAFIVGTIIGNIIVAAGRQEVYLQRQQESLRYVALASENARLLGENIRLVAKTKEF